MKDVQFIYPYVCVYLTDQQMHSLPSNRKFTCNSRMSAVRRGVADGWGWDWDWARQLQSSFVDCAFVYKLIKLKVSG